MNTTQLESLSDAQLSEVFAVEVAGYTKEEDGFWTSKNRCSWHCEDFATSADAVLPMLEKVAFWVDRLRLPATYCVYIELPCGTYVKADDATLPRAACLSLIKAKRAEKGTP